MKMYTIRLIFLCQLLLLVSCSARNLPDTSNHPTEDKIFFRGETINDPRYTQGSAIDWRTLIYLLTADVGEYAFEPLLVTGKIDWDFLSEQWQYQQKYVTYLRKLTLEIETQTRTPLFTRNRVILVHLNKDTLYRDENNLEYVDFRGAATIRLTHHIGVASFRGDIIDVPTK